MFDSVLSHSPDENGAPIGSLIGLGSGFLGVAVGVWGLLGSEALRIASMVALPVFLALAATASWRGRSSGLLWRSALASAMLFGFLRATTSTSEYELIWLYVVPSTVCFFFGRREGTAWSLLALVGWLAVVFGPLLVGGAVPYSSSLIARFLFSYAVAWLLAFEVETRRRLYNKQLTAGAKALRQALDDVEALQGLVPICASCKSIRDDQGFWNKIDRYLEEHSLARVDEALCPECRLETRAEDPV